MNTAAAAQSTDQQSATPVLLVPLNTYWPGKGGIFRGILPGKEGAPDRRLFEHTEELPIGNYKAALAAAAGIAADGHTDFTVPNRAESALLYAVAKDEHKQDDWYWTNEPDGSGYAWCQDFSLGLQDWDHQDTSTRACAVRSEPIQ